MDVRGAMREIGLFSDEIRFYRENEMRFYRENRIFGFKIVFELFLDGLKLLHDGVKNSYETWKCSSKTFAKKRIVTRMADSFTGDFLLTYKSG